MFTQKTPRVRKLVGLQIGFVQIAVKRLMFGLAFCALMAGGAPVAAFDNHVITPPQRIYTLQAEGVWVSDDGGISWTQSSALPSRPLAIAAAIGTPGLVFAGTESAGLLKSNDGGATWLAVERVALTGGHAAPLAVTAVAVDPEDEQIVYAATNIWLGTSTARLTPVGVAVSVDGGRQWLRLSSAHLGDTPLQRLEPVAGRPLTVITVDATGRRNQVNLELSPHLLSLLQDSDPAVRASAARAIGLIGDPAALPGLMQALADPDTLAGQHVAEALGRIGDRSVNAELVNALGAAPAAERIRAALALGVLKSEEAVPGLAVLLRAGDPESQRVAAQALAAIGTPSAIAALMAPLADQRMTSTRHAAMGGLESAGQSAVPQLAAALLDRNGVIRANAAEMLGWLRPGGDSLSEAQSTWKRANVDAALTGLLADPDPAVQVQAAWALGDALAPPFNSGALAGVGTGSARSSLLLPPVILPPILAPILAPGTAARATQAPGVAVLSARESLATFLVLGLLAILAAMLIRKGPRRGASSTGRP